MRFLLLTAILLLLTPCTFAERTLLYSPKDGDFVIKNGSGRFNRALYGGNRGFRIEAGDRPELSLYLPGRGGTLRLGLQGSDGKCLWLSDASDITARYRPGSMIYEVADPLLGSGSLIIHAMPLADAEGLIVSAETVGTVRAVKLIWAFGGSNGERGRRNGDLNAEREPLSTFFALKPDLCRGHVYAISANRFTLNSKPAPLEGIASARTTFSVASAAQWNSLKDLMASIGEPTEAPVVIGQADLPVGQAVYLALRKSAPNSRALGNLSDESTQAEMHRRELVDRLAVETPDPFINSAAGAIAVAADAIWDEEQKVYMHGAIGWRVKLLGWRGPYAGDALGWHDRTAAHFTHFSDQQITSPIAEHLPPADEQFNLARNEAALHSNGYFAGADTLGHYDMNLVAMDVFFRHLLWTGDLDYARKMWPVIQRHLAWERRLFRRPFGPDGVPLYEAYACIWASDELIYNGGGTTHASAYNHWHNAMAARVARLIGEDPTEYEIEAAQIKSAMDRELWLSDRGWFAEFKDYLGEKLVHPSAAAWTFYHTLDSQAASATQAWQMSRYVQTQLPHIPLEGNDVPAGCYTISTTNWMPYMWSINNVVLAESAHTALGLWQADQNDSAFALFKGCLLDSMFMGASPGNVGMSTLNDATGGERYRDFADGVGTASRGLVEGLFGIRPDLLAGKVTIRPGFPDTWDHASIGHPDLNFKFTRDGLVHKYTIIPRWPKPVTVQLEIAAMRDHVAGVTINGSQAKWSMLEQCVGAPRIAISLPPAQRHEVVIQWQGEMPTPTKESPVGVVGSMFESDFSPAQIVGVLDPQHLLRDPSINRSRLSGKLGGAIGHRSAFVHLKQGDLQWVQPISVELRPAWEILPAAQQDASALRFLLRNNTDQPFTGNAMVRVDERSESRRIEALARGQSTEIALAHDGLAPGSHRVSVKFPDGSAVSEVIQNWKLDPVNARLAWDTVDLSDQFNDKLTQIFRNEYRAPRSMFCSLAVPKQGIGGWCRFQDTADIDDTGVREAARKNDGQFLTRLQIPFRTPAASDAKNVIFVSQWTNYPRQVTVPLSGKSSRACLLMAGSTNPMQCRMDNGQIIIAYTDGTSERLLLHNPSNWWPIEQDFYIDNRAFARPEPIPPRLDLKTGALRLLDPTECRFKTRMISGGSGIVLDLLLDSSKELKSITVGALSNEVVIGLMAVSLAR